MSGKRGGKLKSEKKRGGTASYGGGSVFPQWTIANTVPWPFSLGVMEWEEMRRGSVRDVEFAFFFRCLWVASVARSHPGPVGRVKCAADDFDISRANSGTPSAHEEFTLNQGHDLSRNSSALKNTDMKDRKLYR